MGAWAQGKRGCPCAQNQPTLFEPSSTAHLSWPYSLGKGEDALADINHPAAHLGKKLCEPTALCRGPSLGGSWPIAQQLQVLQLQALWPVVILACWASLIERLLHHHQHHHHHRHPYHHFHCRHVIISICRSIHRQSATAESCTAVGIGHCPSRRHCWSWYCGSYGIQNKT